MCDVVVVVCAQGERVRTRAREVERGVEVDHVVVVDESSLFDFGSLPPVLVNVPQVKSTSLKQGGSASKPVSSSLAQAVAASQKAAANQANVVSRANSIGQVAAGNQQVMLGIGLAVAFLALFAVVGIGVFVALRPEEVTRPVIKSSENSNGAPVIIVSD